MKLDAFTLAYTRVAAVVTMLFYTAGHAAIGLPLLVIGGAARLAALRPPLWQRTPLDLPLAAFGVVLVASTLVSAYPSVAIPATLMTLISSAVFFGSFAWLFARDPGMRGTLLRALALGGPPAAVIGMVAGWVTHDRAFFPRMPMATNAFGTTLLVASLTALGLAYRAEGRERRLWFTCGLFTLVGLLATETRSALAGWVVGAVYLTWRELNAYPRQLAAALAAGIAVFAIAATAAPSVASRVGRVSSDLVQDRVQIWRVAAGIVQSYPLLGTGPGTFRFMYDARQPRGERKWSAHNLWLHYAVETGLLGLLSILWVVYAAGRTWARSGRLLPHGADPFRVSITALAVALVVDSCGDNTLLSVSTVSAAWLLLALLVIPVPRPAPAATPGPARVDERPAPTAAPEPALASRAGWMERGAR